MEVVDRLNFLSDADPATAYIPYQLWNELDPKIDFWLRTGRRSASHELLLQNFANIPIFIQHGSADDNVPVYHSRRMYQLLSQNGQSATVEYSELQGKGHWFEGVLTTPALTLFYRSILAKPVQPLLPAKFSLVVSNPAETGSRGGLLVQYLTSPDQLGSIEVTRRPEMWELHTSNIHCFSFDASLHLGTVPQIIQVDDQQFDIPVLRGSSRTFLFDAECVWRVGTILVFLDMF